MPRPVKVFVSYSWATKNQIPIVDEIGKLCPERDIQLIRDNTALKHGEPIDKFMDELSRGDHVITIFSKPYFESKWCMYELLSMSNRDDFEKRILPVITEDCQLGESDFRLQLVNFWNQKFQQERAKIEGIDPLLIQEEIKHVELYRNITQDINKIMNFLAKILITPLTVLSSENYARLLDGIAPIKATNDRITQQSDEDYLREISSNLLSELNKPDHSKFRECLMKNCGFEFGNEKKLPDYLIGECISGRFVEIIQHIESAFVDCFDDLDSSDYIAINKLFGIAEGTVSKLVIFNIRNEWMNQYRQENAGNHHELSLPDMSLGHVEVVASRQARTIPQFHMDRKNMLLHGGRSVALESGIRTSNTTRDIIKKLYFRVMKTELTADLDETAAIADLQETLSQRKRKPNVKLRENYFLLIPNDSDDSTLCDKTVRADLKKLLPDLSLIRLKAGSSEKIFIVKDKQLMTAIREFFNTLETHKAK